MMATTRGTDGDEPKVQSGVDGINGLSYSVAGAELDAIIEEFETGVIDVDRLVDQLERATLIVDELDRRLRRTRMRVEELVPRLEAIGQNDVSVEVVEIDEIEIEFEEDYDDAPSDEDRPPGLF
jgi:exonuclease VII small subunit